MFYPFSSKSGVTKLFKQGKDNVILGGTLLFTCINVKLSGLNCRMVTHLKQVHCISDTWIKLNALPVKNIARSSTG